MKARAGSGISLEEYLTYLDTQGEFNNKMDKPLQELISNGTAYAVGKMGEELVLPLPITLMLSLGAGVTVLLTAGKYVFKDSAGNVLLEARADEVDGIRTQIKRQAQNGSDALEGGIFSGDLMSAEEATRYSEHWRELGIVSDKTWKEFMNANPNGTIDDYFEIVQKQSPWPLGETGTPTTLKTGDRFFMAVENDAPENVIGGFGVKERIESTDFVRNNLAVKYDWKTSCNVIREFEVNSGVELKVNAGPVGPQIDLRADIYLPGSTTISQYDLFSNLGSGIKREEYVHIVDEYWID